MFNSSYYLLYHTSQVFNNGFTISFIKSFTCCDVQPINNFANNRKWGNYDLLYCCNTVFEYEENNKLYKKLVNEFKGVCFLFNYGDKLKNNFHKKYTVKTSWQQNVSLYSFIF